MKSRLILFMTVFIAGFTSCDDDTKVSDPIYEFVSFKGSSSVNLNEFTNSETPYQATVQLYAFQPYSEDVELTLDVTAINAVEGVDFTVSPSDVLLIKAGNLVSEPLTITTINNESASTNPRSVEVRIVSASKSDIKIGLGISDPTNAAITVNILDDECSLTTAIFDGTLQNTIGSTVRTVTGDLSGNSITLKGDLMDYGPFADAELTLTLTPSAPGSTKGKATFGEQETGTDDDGYEYKFVEDGEGSYDVCSGTISIAYDIYYMDGGNWVSWYSTTNVYSVP